MTKAFVHFNLLRVCFEDMVSTTSILQKEYTPFLTSTIQTFAAQWALELATVPVSKDLRILMTQAAQQPGKLLNTSFSGFEIISNEAISLWTLHLAVAYAMSINLEQQFLTASCPPDLIRIAIAIESIGLALDLIDDLQDGDSELTANWGVPVTLTIILALQTLSAKALSALPTLAAIQAESVLQATGGQYDDIAFAGKQDTTLDQAISITARKSGTLVSMVYRMGATLGTSGMPLSEQIELGNLFSTFGTALGVVFQLENDLRDAYNDRKGDRRLFKPTLPLLLEQRYTGPATNRQAYVRATTRVTENLFRQRAMAAVKTLASQFNLDAAWLLWLL